MGLWYERTWHDVAGSFCYGRYGSHHFYGSYDTDRTGSPCHLYGSYNTDGSGSATIFIEVMTRMGQEAPPFLWKL